MAQAPGIVEAPDTAAPAARPSRPRARPDRKNDPQVPPPWRVLLHNDEVNLFENVTRILHRLTPLSMEEAFERTTEAHTHGQAVLLSTHRERAELYVEQLTSAGLTATMEEEV